MSLLAVKDTEKKFLWQWFFSPPSCFPIAKSEMRDLDRIDLKILDILQREGRISVTELADRVNLSATPCSDRVKRMERDGVITGYHARVNPSALGKNLLVFLEIKLSAKSGDVFDKVKKELLYVPEVMECHLVSGDFDYLSRRA